MVSLISGPYLLVVTRKVGEVSQQLNNRLPTSFQARLGQLCGGEVWRVVETEIISYARAEHHLTPRYSPSLDSNSPQKLLIVTFQSAGGQQEVCGHGAAGEAYFY